MLGTNIRTSACSSDSETTSPTTRNSTSSNDNYEYNLVTDWTSVTSPTWTTIQQTLASSTDGPSKTMIPPIVVPGTDKQSSENAIMNNNNNSNVPFVLSVIRQPEEQHRARYLSEGSRGAIKDRSGTSNCTVQLTGYYRPTRVELFATTGSDPVTPHALYRLIPVSGKSANTTPCRKSISHDGIDCLEITLRPESNMTAVLDCIGILKICSYDAKQRKRYHGTAGGQHSAVRIAFRAYIPHDNQTNAFTIIETQSEPIRCVQQLGVPEVMKMSLQSSPARGGDDLFIIGRNFDRNTVVVFREYKDDGTLAWNAEAVIDKQLLHQCHIVCAIPTYCDLYRGGNVSVTVKCGQKSSHPINFVYTPSGQSRSNLTPVEFDDWRPPPSPQFGQRTDMYDDYFDYGPPSSSNLRISPNTTPTFGTTVYTGNDGGKFIRNNGMPYFECDSPPKPTKQACPNTYYTTTQHVATDGCE